MAHILKNKNLEIHIDLPLENYTFSRFDWTGKITKVLFQNIQVSTVESTNSPKKHILGKGFYNEFGIDTALGFEEAAVGDWFHKIGVGLLKKEDNDYQFYKAYTLKPATFITEFDTSRLCIFCTSECINGYGYQLKKEIVLDDHGFTINYTLENTGEKEIITDEYVHNFTAIGNTNIGEDYKLQFPFLLQPALFSDTVNPEQKVCIGDNSVTWNTTPNEPFFFSNLSGNKMVEAQWTLMHLKNNIGIRETTSFKTKKVNLWGTKHVISPELFIQIALKPGQIKKWSRQYEVFKTK